MSRLSERYAHAGKYVDLMLMHLEGATAPVPPKRSVQAVQIIRPKTIIPIHSGGTPEIESHLSFFKREVKNAGTGGQVVDLSRGEELRFHVRG